MKEMIERAWNLFDTGEWTQAEELYLHCWERAEKENHGEYQSILMGLIYVESAQEKFCDARTFARLLLEDSQNAQERHIALHQAGMVERMAGDGIRAMELFRREAEIISAVFPEDDMRISANLYEQAYLFLQGNMLSQAKDTMGKALVHAEKAGDAMCIGCACRGMGEIMKACGKWEQAITYFEKAISAFEQAGDSIAVNEVIDRMQ